MSEQSGAAPASLFEALPSDFAFIVALLLLWVSGAFRHVFAPDAPARPSSIRLGSPRLVAMSATDAADAAHLLGSSVAALMAAEAQSL